MARSDFARALDEVQQGLAPLLKEHGFRKRGRTYNGVSGDGLTLVVNLQMGPFDPPGMTYIPGLQENLYGLFTLNLGVFVPEVAKHQLRLEGKSWVQDYHCCVRARIGALGPEAADLWWPLSNAAALVPEVSRRLVRDGLPFLHRYQTRDQILADADRLEAGGFGRPMKIVCAIILLGRGLNEAARRLLAEQAKDTWNPGHPQYVRELALRLGLGSLDG
jgi:hypothetical protein